MTGNIKRYWSKQMSKTGILTLTLLALMLIAGSSMAGSIAVKLSGPGAVNDSTIKAGENVFFDLYWANDTIRKGFMVGFELSSEDIGEVIHVFDSTGGLNNNGDVKGHNGFENKSIFDLFGIKAPEVDWNGKLPDVIGMGGVVVKQRYRPHEEMKCISWELIVPTPGTLSIDSTFWAPGGYWKYDNGELPQWGGPYYFTVIE